MIPTKRKLIAEEGVDVMVSIPNSNEIIQTVSLIGKATKQFSSEVSLESHRQAQFYPELGIVNGAVVYDPSREEHSLVIATYYEVIRRERAALITRMVVANGFLDIYEWDEDADEWGNISKVRKDIVKNIPVYFETIKNEAKQTDPGVFYTTRYKVMAPVIKASKESNLVLRNDYEEVSLKVEGYDKSTFEGIMLIDARTETRNTKGDR